MADILFSAYRHTDLNTLVDRLNNDYYSIIDTKCKNASSIVYEIEQQETHPSMVLYMSLSTKLLEQVIDFVNNRTAIFIPYILELNTKQIQGHDCSKCAGGCAVNHSMQLVGLKESHQKIKEMLYRLQMVAVPLYTQTDYPDEYRVLRNELVLIDTALTELFYLEEANLIPKVIEAQKNIHVNS